MLTKAHLFSLFLRVTPEFNFLSAALRSIQNNDQGLSLSALYKCLNPCSVHSTELGSRAPKTRNGTGLKKLSSGEVNVSVKGK